MKIFDRYIAKNFLIGYIIAFSVIIGLRIFIDLFVNLDEFTEHGELTSIGVLRNIFDFYAVNTTLYFRDFAGMITVVAAVFSIGKMIRSNEMVALVASGVSLKRIITPIVLLAVVFTGVLVIDQELIIPPLSNKIIRDQDFVPGEETYDVWFLTDNKGSLVCSRNYDVASQTLDDPTIITRQKTQPESLVWKVTGRIDADRAVYNPQRGGWQLENGTFVRRDEFDKIQEIDFYESDLTAQEIPVRCEAEHKNLLSWWQLRKLASHGTKVKDRAQLYYYMHSHVTEPIINLVMLLVALPILVCRDPKAMKSAIMISFAATTSCMVVNFVCNLLASEEIFGMVIPEFWAWLPIFIFLPVALIEIDSMKT
jgi:lipopolysaccharide export system permease protein